MSDVVVRVDANIDQAVNSFNTFFREIRNGGAQAAKDLRSSLDLGEMKYDVVFRVRDSNVVADKVERMEDAAVKAAKAAKALRGEFAKTPAGLKEQLKILIKPTLENVAFPNRKFYTSII